jgi:hypothetical protein
MSDSPCPEKIREFVCLRWSVRQRGEAPVLPSAQRSVNVASVWRLLQQAEPLGKFVENNQCPTVLPLYTRGIAEYYLLLRAVNRIGMNVACPMNTKKQLR